MPTPFSPFSFHIATLGCKVNQYESHALREAWLALGCAEAPGAASAQVVVINSCAVTAKAVADVRATARKLHREAPEAVVILTGCAAEAARGELSRLPGVRAVVGQSHKASLLSGSIPGDSGDIAGSLGNTPGKVSEKAPGGLSGISRGLGGIPCDIDENTPFPPFSVSGYDRSRAVLKVQDGCSHRCTYCIVPLARGPARSRPAREVLAEARRLLASGFREITLSGVNLRQYGHAESGDFWDLLALLEQELAPEWAGAARLRISSLEPGQFTQKALDTLARSRLTAPHLHISLQSGSPSVLRRMGRAHYSPERIPEALGALARIWPKFGLGADLLAGFPGETEHEHEESLRLCALLPLSYAHVFPYSRRPGTVAAAMPGQLPPEVKKRRAAALRSLAAEKRHAFLQSLLSLEAVSVAPEFTAPAFASLAPQPGQRCTGVNEYYVDCLLEGPMPQSCGLTAAAPLRLEKGFLVVRPIEEKIHASTHEPTPRRNEERQSVNRIPGSATGETS